MHDFNFPYQIGSYGDGLDKSVEEKIHLLKGDTILLATDGLFDNLFIHEILDLMNTDTSYNSRASYIANFAYIKSLDEVAETPHATRAKNAGTFFIGGKMDDITVVIININ